MNKIHLVSTDEADAYKLNTSIREFFKDSKLYMQNNIVVSAVKREQQISKGIMIYRWSFDITFFDDATDATEELNSQATFSSGEINVMQVKKVWGFAKLDDYVTREDK